MPLAATRTLCERELTRFFRQRNRVVGALVQPIIFWLLFGQGLSGSFRPSSSDTTQYSEYFFPGIVVMIVLFTAIFATISIIEDRREGFLQEVLIAPIPRWSVVLGKVLGGAILALLQAWIFLLLAPFAGFRLGLLNVFLSSVHLFVTGIALTSLGVCIAWRTDSTQGFHAIMSVFLFPMWLLSGAFFPAEGAPAWLAWTIRLNPLTYAVSGLRRLMYLGGATEFPETPGLFLSLSITAVFAGATFALASWLARAQTVEES